MYRGCFLEHAARQISLAWANLLWSLLFMNNNDLGEDDSGFPLKYKEDPENFSSKYWIYVAINPGYPDWVHIGKTSDLKKCNLLFNEFLSPNLIKLEPVVECSLANSLTTLNLVKAELQNDFEIADNNWIKCPIDIVKNTLQRHIRI